MLENKVITQDKCNHFQVNIGQIMKFSYQDEHGVSRKGVFESCNNQYMYWVQLP